MTRQKLYNATPEGLVEFTEAQYTQHEALNAAYEADKPNRVKRVISFAVQQRLDTFAQEHGFDNIMSACTYASSGVPVFAADGKRCVTLRDATWTKLYDIMAEVEAGTRPLPDEYTGYEDIKAELPLLSWT